MFLYFPAQKKYKLTITDFQYTYRWLMVIYKLSSCGSKNHTKRCDYGQYYPYRTQHSFNFCNYPQPSPKRFLPAKLVENLRTRCPASGNYRHRDQDGNQHTTDSILDISFFMAMAGIFTYGLISFLIGSALLYKFQDLPTLLKYFAIMTLILGVFKLTVVFGFSSILFFPISLLILAFYFIHKPEMIE
jgi:hypothetical protein